MSQNNFSFGLKKFVRLPLNDAYYFLLINNKENFLTKETTSGLTDLAEYPFFVPSAALFFNF